MAEPTAPKTATIPVAPLEINRPAIVVGAPSPPNATRPISASAATANMLDDEPARWWCRRGDLVWRSADHVARYLYDSSGMWGLWVTTYQDGIATPPSAPTALWVYGEPAFEHASATGLPPDEHTQLCGVLESMSPLQLDRPEHTLRRKILACIGAEMPTRAYISASRMKHVLRHDATGDQIDHALRALVPRYVTHGGLFSDGVDRYSLTLAGFDASPLRERVRALLSDALAVIRETFDEDQDMTTCRWDRVQARGGHADDSLDLVTSILRATHLAAGPYPVTPRSMPATCGWQLERLSERNTLFECQGVVDYLDRVRGGTLYGPWPTAPARVIA